MTKLRSVILTFLIILALVAVGTGCPYLNFNNNLKQRSLRSNNITILESSTAQNRCLKTSFTPKLATKARICSAYTEVKEMFSKLLESNVVPKSSLYGSAVRLVFHDAGEIDMRLVDDKLGPDGCLSSDGSSAGLTEEGSIVMQLLEPMYQQVCNRISRADFWVLIGKLVLEEAIHPPIEVAFQYGRQDNQDCEGGAGRLPDPSGGLTEINRVFVDQMGLSINEAVTLLGAHSLGHTHVGASGFGFEDSNNAELRDAWDNTPDVLDNDYFILLVSQKWKAFTTKSGDRMQWRHSQDPFLMLNADIALAYPLNTSALPQTGVPKQICRPDWSDNTPLCKNSGERRELPSTWALCRAFAMDNNYFQLSFVAAFTKMACLGYGRPVPVDGATATGKLGTLTHIDLNTC